MLRFRPLGDRAIVVRLGESADEPTHRRVRAAWSRLTARPVRGMLEVVAGFTGVTVHYDPAAFPAGRPGEMPQPYATLSAELAAALGELRGDDLPAARTVEIEVCYGGDAGPDLEDLARYHRMSSEEVVRIHLAGEYLVHLIGFVPGFPYLAGLDPRLATPRRASPRARVPASSVAIGGAQTGIYPIDAPGGWHLIGRSPERLFRPERDPPTLLRMGDRVRFREITAAELRARGGQA